MHDDVWIEYSCRKRDEQDVIEESPSKILFDVKDDFVAKFDCGNDIKRIASHKDDVSGVDRDVGTRSDGDANIGFCEGWSIIHAIADKGHFMTFVLETRNNGFFVSRKDLRIHIINA